MQGVELLSKHDLYCELRAPLFKVAPVLIALQGAFRAHCFQDPFVNGSYR